MSFSEKTFIQAKRMRRKSSVGRVEGGEWGEQLGVEGPFVRGFLRKNRVWPN